MYDVLKAQGREAGRKHNPKEIRKGGDIPCVIFGKEIESLPIRINTLALDKFIRAGHQVFEIDVEGKKHLVGLNEIQKDPVSWKILHASFQKINAKKKTHLKLPIHWVGTSQGSQSGGIVGHLVNEIDVYGLPADMPESIEVDVTELELNGSIQLKEVPLPKGLELHNTDEEKTIASCTPPRAEVEPEMEVSDSEEATASSEASEETAEEAKKAS